MSDLTKESFDKFIERLRYWNDDEGVNEHMTADPIFLVEKKIKVCGLAEDYSDEMIWLDMDNDYSEYESLDEFYNSIDDDGKADIDLISQEGAWAAENFMAVKDYWQEHVLELAGHNLQQTWFVEEWEYVCSHFTKEGADAFIKRKNHDYPLGLRVFVDAQVYCWEYRQIIKGLLDGDIGFVRHDD